MASRKVKPEDSPKSQATWCCISRPAPAPWNNAGPDALKIHERVASRFSKISDQKQENGHHKVLNSRSKSVDRSSFRKLKPAEEKSTAKTKSVTARAGSVKQPPKIVSSKLDKVQKCGELAKAAGEALKSGEIAALIKQGFISDVSIEKTNGTQPNKTVGSDAGESPAVVDSELPAPPAAQLKKFSDFSSFLNETMLNQSSVSVDEKKPSATTLYDMMLNDQDSQDKDSNKTHINRASSSFSSGTEFNDPVSSDVKLSLKNKEGTTVTVYAHSNVLAAHSRFFASKIPTGEQAELPHFIEISDCDDIEMYVETLRLMYSKEMKKMLLKETVHRVLLILKISTTIVFEAGMLSCLEYLEAVPWAEEDEEKITSLLTELHLETIGGAEVLQRLSVGDPSGSKDVLVSLLHLVTKGADEKARREMKGLVSRMLRENTAQGRSSSDLSKDSLYESCHGCLRSLIDLFLQASKPDMMSRLGDERGMLIAQITRQADNLNWLVDILIDRQIADEFVKIWAFQAELATLHRQVPIIFGRYEVSRLTAGLCIALGKGQVLAPKEVRFMLLQNWLQPLIDDFGWMQRACKGLDRKVVEEGISQTILTLPLKQQQTIMLAWFDRFLKNGDDCPNLQKAFEIWWRRTFVRSSSTENLLPGCQ